LANPYTATIIALRQGKLQRGQGISCGEAICIAFGVGGMFQHQLGAQVW